MHGRFSDPYFNLLREELKLDIDFFFFIWVSATNSFDRSGLIRWFLIYGCAPIGCADYFGVFNFTVNFLKAFVYIKFCKLADGLCSPFL